MFSFYVQLHEGNKYWYHVIGLFKVHLNMSIAMIVDFAFRKVLNLWI